jgi:hypothetical protein
MEIYSDCISGLWAVVSFDFPAISSLGLGSRMHQSKSSVSEKYLGSCEKKKLRTL